MSVCDQPFLDTDIIGRLVARSMRYPEHIIPSAYSATVGPPVIFPRRYFHELAMLSGKQGAKKVIMRHMEKSIPVAFPKGGIDVDTASDAERMQAF